MLRSFTNLKVAYKLLIPLSLLLITIGAILWIAPSGMGELRADTTKSLDVVAGRQVQAVSMTSNLNDAAIQENRAAVRLSMSEVVAARQTIVAEEEAASGRRTAEMPRLVIAVGG